jgi:hypothetical protein
MRESDCDELIRACERDPYALPAHLARHAAGCAGCQRYLDHARRFEALLFDAINVELPPVPPEAAGTEPKRVDNPRWNRRRVITATAGLATVGAGAGTIWLAGTRQAFPLGAEVVAHIRHEAEALEAGRAVIPPSVASELLAHLAIRIDDDPGPITWLRLCAFSEGRRVPHVVIGEGADAVTVMLFTGESLTSPIEIACGDLFGRIVPVSRGGVALVRRDIRIEHETERKILSAFRWPG